MHILLYHTSQSRETTLPVLTCCKWPGAVVLDGADEENKPGWACADTLATQCWCSRLNFSVLHLILILSGLRRCLPAKHMSRQTVLVLPSCNIMGGGVLFQHDDIS